MPIYLWVVFFYLIKYVHYYKELELTMSKLYSYFKLENVEIVSETVATVCFFKFVYSTKVQINIPLLYTACLGVFMVLIDF